VANSPVPSQSGQPSAVAPHAALYRAVVSIGFGLSSLSSGASRRPHPRWEPDAVIPLVRICPGALSDECPYRD